VRKIDTKPYPSLAAMLTAQTKFDSERFITRRRVLASLAGAFRARIALGNLPQQNEPLTSSLQYGLIDALDEHGQWAAGPSWAKDIHQSMGADVTVFARATMSGDDSVATATGFALQRLVLSEHRPDGAIVVVCGRPGALRLRDAYSAYRMVRSNLRPDAYCAYSPLSVERQDDHITAEVTLGWRIHRKELDAAWLRN
jgi:hypothetical protein